MPAGKEPSLVSEPLHTYKQGKKVVQFYTKAEFSLLIKALSGSEPFPKGKGRNHHPRFEASNLNVTEIHLNESHNKISEHTSEGKCYSFFYNLYFMGPVRAVSSWLKV